MESRDLTHLAPKVIVGGEGNVDAVVGEFLEAYEGRAAREGGVVGFLDLVDDFGGGDDEDISEAEAERDEGTVSEGEAVEIGVGVAAVELVEVADEGEMRRAGRAGGPARFGWLGLEVEDEEEGEEEEEDCPHDFFLILFFWLIIEGGGCRMVHW
ncbi:tRNA-specific 2-thiouridylase MnmA [Striga asiatica]|uniref:tRNA-specific 2-thiouridylase MnmA n=1 Tax=Striga asiatica TaxID=4170 RepID=A0A5A7P2X9_STRAF|nr:tRNA-specific 2-thiouridylase MnmA [Striga asiatica]